MIIAKITKAARDIELIGGMCAASACAAHEGRHLVEVSDAHAAPGLLARECFEVAEQFGVAL